MASAEPVAMAVRGMSPSLLLRGRRVWSAVSTVFEQGATAGIVICRRQRPSWITSGMLVPAGMFSRVKVPSGAVCVSTSGLPETSPPHWLQVTPAGNAWTFAFGT